MLQPGDADMDLDFDQLDLVQVQIAAKYLTDQPATWGEGDWNGAPGGSPGNPPPGNENARTGEKTERSFRWNLSLRRFTMTKEKILER